MNKLKISIYFICFSLLPMACNDDQEKEETITESSIEFVLSNGDKVYQATDSNPYLPTIITPLLENEESRIVDYVRINYFQLDDESGSSINIQLHEIVDVNEGQPDYDQLLLNGVSNNEAAFVIDWIDYRGLGVMIEYDDEENKRWYSYNDLAKDVNQEGSEFDIYEVIDLDTAVYIKVRFNCKLFNESEEELTLDSGELTFRLK